MFKTGIATPSSYWLTHFPDLPGILLKSGWQPVNAFKREQCISGSVSTNGKEEIKSEEKSECTINLYTCLVTSKL
jgi:hypothetical protein